MEKEILTVDTEEEFAQAVTREGVTVEAPPGMGRSVRCLP